MEPDPCFDEQELASIAGGSLPEDRRPRIEGHLAACPSCAAQTVHVWAVAEKIEDSGAALRRFGRPSAIGWRRWRWGVAAAGLAMLTGGLYLLPLFRLALPKSPLGRYIPLASPGAAVEIAGQAEGGDRYRLSDGSFLTLKKGAQARLHPPQAGERVSLELERGAVEVQAARREGLFRIRSEAGEIRVLGTRFNATAVSIERFTPMESEDQPRPSPLTCLCVDVQEGKVSLENPHGRVVVGASNRGVALSDRAPVHLDRRGTRRKIVSQLVPIVERASGGVRVRPGLERQAEFLAALYRIQEDEEPPAEGPGEAAALELLERMGRR